MFTGLIERIGVVKSRLDRGGGARLEIDTGPEPFEAAPGDSVAVDGICLTIAEKKERGFTMDVSEESLQRSTLSSIRTGTKVNLERALCLGERLGGHLVTGHIDAKGKIAEARPEGGFTRITIAAPPQVIALAVEKGSIAVDGISLTVNGVQADRFWVTLIPQTLARTTLGAKKPGEPVNLETDLIGKYVARLMGRDAVENQDLKKKLLEEGFI